MDAKLLAGVDALSRLKLPPQTEEEIRMEDRNWFEKLEKLAFDSDSLDLMQGVFTMSHSTPQPINGNQGKRKLSITPIDFDRNRLYRLRHEIESTKERVNNTEWKSYIKENIDELSPEAQKTVEIIDCFFSDSEDLNIKNKIYEMTEISPQGPILKSIEHSQMVKYR